MKRHAFERDESGTGRVSRYETGMPAHGVHPMRWQGRASLPLRQQGHACVPNYSASKDASPDTSGTACASCEATEPVDARAKPASAGYVAGW